ncbi:PQQ-binding-like beta-propeller repeat protein [Streptomyces sp. NPDC051940]|uniref:outer membrane protein assembly factor BamB family protein n=1 Tax=Streptomyces sp. NPDC051940 TaxID=3155675 RepID=UPI00341C3E7D
MRAPVRRRALLLGGVAMAGGGAGAWWLLAGRDGPPAKPWHAQPIKAYEAGPPRPLWRLDGIAADTGPPPVPIGRRVAFAARAGGIATRTVVAASAGWAFPAADAGRGMLPAAGLLVAADENGTVHALDPRSGRTRWASPAARAQRLLAADQFTLYVITPDHDLRAVSLRGGAVLWTRPCPVEPLGSSDRPGAEQTPRATAGAGRLVVHDRTGHAATLDAENGVVLWQRKDLGPGPLTPVIVKLTVYLAGTSLLALSLPDGKEHWRSPGSPSWGEPAYYDGRIYAHDGSRLLTLDPASGRRAGSPVLDTDDTGDTADAIAPSAPVVQHRTVCVLLGPDGSQGLALCDLRRHTPAFLRTPDGRTPWLVAGSGNRLFAQHRGTVLALPVV